VKKVEVLSPVGGPKSLKPAVENGADAVYFGVGSFNARQRAESFSVKQLRDAVAYAHDNGVRAYGAFNILIKNSELREFFYTISDAYASGIDGIIIQHISFARILKDAFPDLRIHMSTQAGIINTCYSDLLYGADRVTIPREFSLAELKYFVDKIGLETDVFVHGALCFSYSGQCLFSSLLGGRSGNRGVCAQAVPKEIQQQLPVEHKGVMPRRPDSRDNIGRSDSIKDRGPAQKSAVYCTCNAGLPPFGGFVLCWEFQAAGTGIEGVSTCFQS